MLAIIRYIFIVVFFYMAPLVKRLIKRKVLQQDTGWLFLNDRGQRLHIETITQDVARLRRIAGISERATAHMLRHRWITIQVLERLKTYIGQKLPVDIATTILTKVASMTGHKPIESLWTYIDFAFEEMGIWDTAESVINMRMNAEAAHRELCEIRSRVSMILEVLQPTMIRLIWGRFWPFV